MEYLVDGGGSRAIRDAVHPVLTEIRAMLGADLGVVVYQPERAPGPPVILASTAGSDDVGGFLAHEPVVVEGDLPRRAPASIDRLAVRSRLRPHGVRLHSSVVVPWRDRHGWGAVVVGNLLSALAEPEPVLDDQLRRHRRALGRAIGRARRSGSLELGRELRRATRTVAEATAAGADGTTALSILVSSTRELFGSEVAYLAVPDGASGSFVFDQVLGIRTASFRRLRVAHGQGLGGLARRTGVPVRSANYEADGRLEAAPVDETRGEGIVSAMAAPVSVGDEIAAVLYVGARRMRPFTTVDEDLLAELAGHAAPAVRRRHAEIDPGGVLERAVRERVAYDLHDSVVRGLVTIGFEVEQARHTEQGADTATHLDTVARAAEACLSRLRGELGLLIGGSGTAAVPASEVLDRIAAVPRRGAERDLELVGDDLELSPTAADALVRVGQEAVTNAERHSGCRRLVVRVTTTAHAIGLQVLDDGTFDAAARDGAATHLGVPAMRAAVAGVGGQVTVSAARPTGTLVDAVVPPRPRAEVSAR